VTWPQARTRSCHKRASPGTGVDMFAYHGSVRCMQTDAFRDSAHVGSSSWRSAISGAVLGPDEVSVDHEAPRTFQALLEAFALREGLDLRRCSLTAMPLAIYHDKVTRSSDMSPQRGSP
jgi:hypothetical protein